MYITSVYGVNNKICGQKKKKEKRNKSTSMVCWLLSWPALVNLMVPWRAALLSGALASLTGGAAAACSGPQAGR